MKNNVEELANVIMGNLAPGADDSFNISPIIVTASKLNAELGAPETKLEVRIRKMFFFYRLKLELINIFI